MIKNVLILNYLMIQFEEDVDDVDDDDVDDVDDANVDGCDDLRLKYLKTESHI